MFLTLWNPYVTQCCAHFLKVFSRRLNFGLAVHPAHGLPCWMFHVHLERMCILYPVSECYLGQVAWQWCSNHLYFHWFFCLLVLWIIERTVENSKFNWNLSVSPLILVSLRCVCFEALLLGESSLRLVMPAASVSQFLVARIRLSRSPASHFTLCDVNAASPAAQLAQCTISSQYYL